MRADNEGEGGILALFALAQRRLITGSTLGAGGGLAGARRHGVLLLRCADHAGHLGAERGRGPGAARSRTSSSAVVPVTLAVHRRAVRLSAPRHGARRQPLRPDHGGVVRGDRGHRRACRSCAIPAVLAALNPLYGTRAAGAPPAGGARDHRRGVPRHHRRRGAVRGHGPFRQAAGARRPGSRWCGRRWCSTTSARARCCSSSASPSQQPLYHAGARARCCRGW